MRRWITLVEAVDKPMEFSEDGSILMWHGAHAWEGWPELRPAKQGRYEAGPGFYTTNRYATARKYSKGNGAMILVKIKPNMRLADNVMIPLADMVDFVTRAPRMPKKKELITDLKHHAERMKSDQIAANILINLVVNHEAGAGKAGMAVAVFLKDHGVDASLENQSGKEQWLIIYNPGIIQGVEKIPVKDIPTEMHDLPSI